MSGRTDYEERKQARIDRLNDAAGKAAAESVEAINRSYNLTKDIPLGQPNIHGALTGVLSKSRNAADRAVALNEKSGYYADRAESAENNHAISSDDPAAAEKIKAKIAELEEERTKVKESNKVARKNGTEPAPWYTLPYIGKEIKRLKDRLAKLEQVDQMPAEVIQFADGKIESDPETNRVIIRFEERQNDNMTSALKSHGFHWSPSVKAWTRLRNPAALFWAKKICKIKEPTP